MSPPVAHRPSGPARTLCLGGALVDLVGQPAGRPLTEAERFSPHFGGPAATVAVFAARLGATVALAGGAGDDVWGRWLRERLISERVDISMFELLPGRVTPLALVSVGADGEPSHELRGDDAATVVTALHGRVEEAMRASAALLVTSDTLVAADERAVTMRAREVALGLGRPVIFDANLRLARWASRADAAASANACVRGALMVRANRAEARLMTGEDDPERAALALVKAGARLVVLTLGREGAILRGAMRARAPGMAGEVLSTAGAGEALTGTLLARLALSGFYPSSVAAALPEAVAAASAACQRWGALD